jgi:hypothetical protein
MSSFTLRGLDPTFWAKVQAKAKADGVTVKTAILSLLAKWIGVIVVALLLAGCDAMQASPTQPSTIIPPAPSVAPPAPVGGSFSIQIDSNGGQTFTDTVWQTVITVSGSSTPARVTVNCNNGAPLQEYPGFTGPHVISCAFGSVGTYTVFATALGANGAAVSDRTTVEASVRPVPPPPVIPPPAPAPTPVLTLTLSCTPKAANTQTPCNITASYNGAPQTSNLTDIAWNWGDATTTMTGGTPYATHAYPQPGSYRLIVSAVYNGHEGSTASTLVIP